MLNSKPHSTPSKIASVPDSRSVQREEQVHGKPAWLELFFQKRFFTSCSLHELSKNEKNMNCIDCDLPICRYCVSSSGSCGEHNALKIYKHVYQDAVLASDMIKFIDCSNIQLYKCNKKLVVSLHPLPHKGKGAQLANTSSACAICTRILHEPDLYSYCSLACKVEAFSKKVKATDHPFLELGASAAVENGDRNAADMVEQSATAGLAVQIKNKRKGVPHRAPSN